MKSFRGRPILLVFCFLAVLALLPACRRTEARTPTPTLVPAPTFAAVKPPDSMRDSLFPWIPPTPGVPVFSNPVFVNHPHPDITLASNSEQLLLEAGCHAGEYNWECDADSPLSKFDCDKLTSPAMFSFPLPRSVDLWGALQPAYPIVAVCFTEIDNWRVSTDHLYAIGCDAPADVSYVVFRDGDYEDLQTQAEFQAVFAPIESANEALSYVLMTTGLEAYYGLQPVPDYVYFADTIEDTHVTETTGGYIVHLYYDMFCGCPPHMTSVVDVFVRYDGTTQWFAAPAYYPLKDMTCVDY